MAGKQVVKRFTVVCPQSVEDELANLLVIRWGTPLVEQIASAADRIDAELAMRADELGGKVKDNIRTLTVYPLAIEYEVRVDDRLVTILSYELTTE